MKKCLSIVLACCIGAATGNITFANPNINILINGQALPGTGEAMLIQNRTMVPFRAVFEGLGAEQTLWDQETKTVTGVKAGTTVTLSIGSNVAFVNGQVENLEVEPTIIDNSTLVPLSFISQKLGYQVVWQGSTKTVQIMTPEYYEQVKDFLQGNLISENANAQNAGSTANISVPKPQNDNKPTIPSNNNISSGSGGNVSASTIKGSYAMQNMNKDKFVMQFGANGDLKIANVASKTLVKGTYKVSDKSLSITSSVLNGTYSVEQIKGSRIYYMMKSQNGSAFAMTSITAEQFTKAVQR